MLRIIVLASFAAVLAAATISLVPPARAQIGTIFSDPPPRPPGSVPRRGELPPDDGDEDDVPDLPPGGRVVPVPNRPPPGQQGYAMPGPVQSQPLAPVPGTAVVPGNVAPGIAVRPPQPGEQQAIAPPVQHPQPKGAPQGSTDLQPGDEIVTEPPPEKIINKTASFAGLDKITGRIFNFDEKIGETVQFGALRVKTDACYTRPATEAANTDAFVEVDEITLKGEVKRIFSGWMFASSPGLHAVEHPVYDIWLTDCKDPENTVVSAAPTEQPKAAPSASPVVQQKRPPAPRKPRAAAPRPAPPPPQLETQQQPPPQPQPRQQSGGLLGLFR